MSNQRVSDRGGESSPRLIMDHSDFSPVFWMATAPVVKGGGQAPYRKRRMTVWGIPVNYTLVIGIVLSFLILLQQKLNS
jgi:hypothetical protein